MSGSQQLLLVGKASSYQISRSVRLRSSASASLTRTNASGGSTQIITFSFWVKRGKISSGQYLTTASQASVANDYIRFESDDTFSVCLNNASTAPTITSSAVYRDPSAWYHIVVGIDTTQATGSDRMKAYVNGVQITSFSSATYPAQNFNMRGFNSSSILQYIGAFRTGADYFDGYITEAYFIDGQQLTPASFGAFDAITGVWNPKKYSGTYGTNGFYINFSDNSNNTAATLGKDSSGNGNNWTPNNISVTNVAAPNTNDSMVDTPTNYGTDTGVGQEVRGNYAVLSAPGSYAWTLSNGNLSGAGGNTNCYFSMPIIGKMYFEVYVNTIAGGAQMGFSKNATIGTATIGYNQSGYYGVNYAASLTYWVNGTNDGINHGTLVGNTLKFAVDAATGKVWIGSGSVWFNSGDPAAGTSPAFTISVSTGDLIFPMLTSTPSYTMTLNAGQQTFGNAAPSGFKAMCTQNMTTPTISNGANYMAATLYTGTGASQTVSNAVNSISFQPDLVWIKSRSAATNNKLTDSVRGATKAVISNTSGAETTDTNGLTAFGSSGFTVGTDTVYNNSGATYVGWNWKGGGTAVTNNDGNRTASVSASTTAGFSVVTYTFSTSATNTIGHGLGAAPSMLLSRNRTVANNWDVYHISLGYTQRLILNDTGAASGGGWAATPTSTVFSVTTGLYLNNDNIVTYCFAPITGYSAFGSYTGNGSSDGPFVFTGFRPRWIMVKRTDSAANWYLWDTSRDTYNVAALSLVPNSSIAESSSNALDILSNGFKLRATGADWNASGGTFIYAAFAENPFTLARAC